jgi:zinc transport system substrate-binding protein
VTNLAGGAVEPHDLELTVSQIYALTTSDLVIYQRGFQPAVDAGVDQSQIPRIFDVTTVVPLETREEGIVDQHIWLDPVLMATIAGDVASLLSEIDPEGEEYYRANLEGLLTTLNRLDEDYSQGLAACERREFLVEHAAFGYMADRYDLTQLSLKGVNPDAEISPAHLAHLYEEVENRGLTTIFYESSRDSTFSPPGSIQAIAEDLNLSIWVLDPLEQAPEQMVDRPNKYHDVMAMNLQDLRQANGCQ